MKTGGRHKTNRLHSVVLCFSFLAATGLYGHASVALLVEEPYGKFGAISPTGHAAVYFNHICADSPVVLRVCGVAEHGVVISRYQKIDGYDWIAMPLIGYLYAVNSPGEIPLAVDRDRVTALRNAYREEHLLKLAPDSQKGRSPKGGWIELVGSSFDRTIHGFQVESTQEQDERFITFLNDRRNVGHFNLFFHNCADFSRVVLDTFLPHAIHRNFLADFGLMTPKQVARSLVNYGRKHPGLEMTAFIIPQVPGSLPRSHSVDGVAESIIKSKKYLLPMVAFAPEVMGGVVVAYLVDGRFKLPKDMPVFVFDIGAEETASLRSPVTPDEVLPAESARTTPLPPLRLGPGGQHYGNLNSLTVSRGVCGRAYIDFAPEELSLTYAGSLERFPYCWVSQNSCAVASSLRKTPMSVAALDYTHRENALALALCAPAIAQESANLASSDQPGALSLQPLMPTITDTLESCPICGLRVCTQASGFVVLQPVWTPVPLTSCQSSTLE